MVHKYKKGEESEEMKKNGKEEIYSFPNYKIFYTDYKEHECPCGENITIKEHALKQGEEDISVYFAVCKCKNVFFAQFPMLNK